MSPSDLVITKWGARYRGRHLPCAIGRGGIGHKQGEGDGITPVGVFEIAEIWTRPDRLWIGDAFAIGPMDKWSDDPTDPAYNTHIRAVDYSPSHEKLRRADPLYDAIGVLTYNYPNPKSGKGSAIFLHQWRKARHPTEGCVAFSRGDLAFILGTWDHKARVIING